MSLESGGIGRPVLRKEDARLLTGRGCFSDDLAFPDQAFAVIMRSPHPHALIRSVSTASAERMPGVLAVLTARDLDADGLKPMPYAPWSAHPVDLKMPNRDGSPHFTAPYRLLAGERTRFVGEAVAVAVADTAQAAKDAAEAIVVDYAPLPAVTDARSAIAPDAPRVWEQLASNAVVDADVGDAAATAAAFARATHVIRLETQVNRVTGVPMEPRAAVGQFDSVTGRYTVHAGTAGSIRTWQAVAAALNVPPEAVRAVVPDVGGSFGTRAGAYPEFALVAWAAKRVGRPVKWTGERTEVFLTDFHARDLWVRAELALDEDGNILAMRGESLSNVGAFNASFVPLQKSTEIMTGIYSVPVVHWHPRAIFTHTSPTFPYRSTGRPEAMFVIERLLDLAARDCGFDRLDLRRRNLVPAEAMPYTNPFGIPYDSGLYHQAFESALALGEWQEFAARRAEARKRGRLRGIGVGTYVETATGSPRERAEVTVRAEGVVEIAIGTTAHGQGHETVFAQLITEWLGVPVDKVRLISGDTDAVKIGGGSSSGRSMRLASLLVQNVTRQIVERATAIASHLLETAPIDIRFKAGAFTVAGTDRSVSLFEVAAAAAANQTIPESLRGPLSADCDQVVTVGSFPYGTHVCEVEIDPQTGAIDIVGYAAVDDVGRAVNPMLVDGQTHGGIAQGVGQALWEHCVYDRESGQA
ncbi:MAG: aerobic carbon-monoxide dehydrogenase large subunit, partial [Variibacter sp.]|nr:aerobic carbon-monoxide dehydrogenase large subunit [Variibacter sp.]